MTKWSDRLNSQLLRLGPLMQAQRKHMPSYIPMHVALLYSGSRLVACATNAYVKHAEINCMDDIDPSRIKRHKPLRLIVTKISGCHNMSRPCKQCCQEIRRRLPSARVFYTAEDGTLCEDYDLDNAHVNLAQRNVVSRRW